MFLKYIAILIGFLCLTMGYKTPHTESPEVTFKMLEERLLHAKEVKLAFQVSAVGAVSADIHGILEMETGAGIMLKGRGSFGGDSVDLELRADNYQVEFGNRSERKVADTPPKLREALLIGLTRMGILHNLARLTGNELPDHAEGGVREWVVVDSFTRATQCEHDVSFVLTVAGTQSGSVSLQISPSGQPVERHQTVQFPSGEMRVVEQYSDVTISQ